MQVLPAAQPTCVGCVDVPIVEPWHGRKVEAGAAVLAEGLAVYLIVLAGVWAVRVGGTAGLPSLAAVCWDWQAPGGLLRVLLPATVVPGLAPAGSLWTADTCTGVVIACSTDIDVDTQQLPAWQGVGRAWLGPAPAKVAGVRSQLHSRMMQDPPAGMALPHGPSGLPHSQVSAAAVCSTRAWTATQHRSNATVAK